MAKRESFQYKPREKDAVKRRANQSGGLFDSLFKAQFSVFTPKEGDYVLRAMPPTWDDAQHYGLDVYVHYGIGSDNQSYLCLDKMRGERCPLCEARKAAEREDPDYAKTLAPTKRVLVWLVDRADEAAGPQLYSMPWTMDRDLANLAIDKKSGELLLIDDPEGGFDIEFSRKGVGMKTKYSGIGIARRSSPLCDDERTQEEWLRFILDNPLPEVLQFFDYDHIASVAAGQKSKETDKDEDEDEPETRSSRRRPAADEDEEPVTRSSRRRPPPEEEEEDLPPRRRAEPADDDDDSPRRRSFIKEKEADEKPRRRSGDDEEEADGGRPTTRTTARSDDEDPPRRRSRPVEDDYEAPPPRRRSV